ncbi:MAG: carbon starvation CstA family protein [Candidatus Latescibacterota bacterium]|nr:carbon starvation CstA family protein [Candidatus Latescibacterota bacterium]
MNVLLLLVAGLFVFWLASRYYGAWVANRVGLDPVNSTPAQQINDGRDYVPTRLSVVFAHHFSSIAGAGPIVGPTLAAIYGFVPALMWVVLGGIFIGAVHDFTALFASMREGGKSMAEIAHKSMGRAGFTLFLLFTIVMIVLITAVFLKLTAAALTSLYPVDKLGLDAGQTLLRTKTVDGVEKGIIGGIASTSVIVVTCLAPLLGWLLYRKGIATPIAYVLGAVLCIGSVYIGIAAPLSIEPMTWMIVISVYVLFAAGAPVWVILQPRDFINSQILYGGMVLMLFSLVTGGLGGLAIHFPAFNLAGGIEHLGLIWPMMFVTIACGAISGFHCLVSSGTTCKQCESEADAKRIGFDGMLLECVLAMFVLLAIGSALGFADYQQVVWVEGNPVLGFSLAAGGLLNKGLGFVSVALGTVFGILMLEGFLVTTLDSAVRLNRYLFEELWDLLFEVPPALMKKYWFNAGLSVALMWTLASSNAATAIWPVFGSSNQLLAALALLVVSTWLLNRGSTAWFTLLPAGFMMATTLYSLVLLMKKHIPAGDWILVTAEVLLFCLALGVIGLAIRTHVRPRTATATEE